MIALLLLHDSENREKLREKSVGAGERRSGGACKILYRKWSIKRRYSNKRCTFTENNLISTAALIWVLTY